MHWPDCHVQEAARLYLFGGHCVEIATDKSEQETVFSDLWQLDLKTYQVQVSLIVVEHLALEEFRGNTDGLAW